MVAAKCSWKPDRAPLVAYMSALSVTPTETEACGLFRWFLSLRAGCAEKQLHVAVEALKFVRRLELHTKFVVQWKLLLPWANGVLCALLQGMRKQKLKDAVFLELNSRLVELVVPKTPLDLVVKATDWTHLRMELSQVVASGTLGALLFSGCMSHLVAKAVQVEIDRGVDACFDEPKMHEATYMEAKRSTMKNILQIEGVEALHPRRSVNLQYRGERLQVKVCSLLEWTTLAFDARLKANAVRQGKLQELTMEDVLIPRGQYDAEPKAGIAAIMVRQAQAAREHVKVLLADANASSSDMLMKVVLSKTPGLMLMDSNFKVELAMLRALAGDEAEERFLRKILEECMPSATRPLPPETSAQRLNELASSTSHKFAPRHLQGIVAHVQALVAAIMDSRPPQVQSAAKKPELQQVVASLQWFAQHKVGGKLLQGDPAIKAMLDELLADKKAAVTMEQITPVQVWAWRLTHEQRAALQEVVTRVGADAATTVQSLHGKSKDKGAKDKEKAKQKDAILKSSLDMFR
jgi:hypothetical protein